MQIPLVESRLALLYSSWFSDSEFAFFVRGFGHALFSLIRRNMKKVVRLILWAVFVIYCLILIYILFLSRGSLAHYSYDRYFRQFTNFIPFKTIIEYIQRYRNGFQNLSVTNLLGNFVLFLPMGMALPCLSKKLNRFWKVVLCVLGIVVLVEIAQGLLRVGSVDIDDVIFNLSGAMIGYGIVKIPFINKLLVKVKLRTDAEN